MNLDPSPDQETLRGAVERIVEPFREPPPGVYVEALDGAALYARIEAAGFLEVADLPEFGAVGAVLILEIVAGLPYSVPLAGALLVAPMLGLRPNGPVALMRAGDAAVRHLPGAASILVDDGGAVRLVDAAQVQVRALETPFADLHGALGDGDLSRFPAVEGVTPDAFRQWRQVALAAEVGAVARAAIRQTVDYVKLRRQFDRPIGSFQAIQHRLAECEALQHGIEALARWAAGTGDPAAAALAAAHAQAAAGRIAYDAQQFHGASGLTRESSLHFSTYRLRALQGELGGLAEQSLAAADALWPTGTWPARPGADWR
jgi:hypothetical protein